MNSCFNTSKLIPSIFSFYFAYLSNLSSLVTNSSVSTHSLSIFTYYFPWIFSCNSLFLELNANSPLKFVTCISLMRWLSISFSPSCWLSIDVKSDFMLWTFVSCLSFASFINFRKALSTSFYLDSFRVSMFFIRVTSLGLLKLIPLKTSSSFRFTFLYYFNFIFSFFSIYAISLVSFAFAAEISWQLSSSIPSIFDIAGIGGSGSDIYDFFYAVLVPKMQELLLLRFMFLFLLDFFLEVERVSFLEKAFYLGFYVDCLCFCEFFVVF